MSQLRSRKRGKYLNLGIGELAAATVFAVIAAPGIGVLPFITDADATVALWCALLPLLIVLVQAGVYWLSARSWVGRGDGVTAMPMALARTYRLFRILDPVVLLAGLIGIVLNVPDEPFALVFVLFVWLFGVIEYLNYFVVRLAYPVSRWPALIGQWRRPQLVKDLRDAG